MFKKSRRKIVAAILSVLVLVICGTFGIIYLASYVQMTNENRELLRQYVDSYGFPEEPGEEKIKRDRETMPKEPPMLELSTFYSVAISDSGEVLKIDTAMSPCSARISSRILRGRLWRAAVRTASGTI